MSPLALKSGQNMFDSILIRLIYKVTFLSFLIYARIEEYPCKDDKQLSPKLLTIFSHFPSK